MTTDDAPTILRLAPPSTCTCASPPCSGRSDLHPLSTTLSARPQPLHATGHRCTSNPSNMFAFCSLLILLFQVLASADASTIRQIGDAALCPFEAKQDRDDTRTPATITQLTCKFSKSMILNTDSEDAMPTGITCEQIGGTCKQIHTTLGVSYAKSLIANRAERSLGRSRGVRSVRRHHNIRVNSACVCVLSNGKPALPVNPIVEDRR
ncbi:uncharacterized protein LOC132200898 [Neocloeon triangulifer]|uniref:uncharacterized protein LOC132200898 n=1 Tax=Neocloeon triangulifer TaxID=2078957 RepID=UPI00286F717E|nr:uncharacterized protein LOC132200898 [Neocloeon triangulifer]